jgi:hypothetical protein
MANHSGSHAEFYPGFPRCERSSTGSRELRDPPTAAEFQIEAQSVRLEDRGLGCLAVFLVHLLVV